MGKWVGVFAIVVIVPACGSRPAEIEFDRRAFVAEEGDTVWGEFGYLRVPEWHDRPFGDSIDLAVARLAATGESGKAPIIYLEGGPGGAGIHPERFRLLQRLRAHGDVITFDQRGTGASEADLSCGPARELSSSEAQTREAWLAVEMEEAKRCAEAIAARGVDLEAYNVIQSAEDVEAIRVALGVDAVRLVGISFGSHLALATLKRYDDRVERVVLAGVEGPRHTVKLPAQLDQHLARVSELIATDPVAAEILPDFEELVRETAAELDREPRIVELDGDSILLTGFKFRRLVAGSIVRRQFLRFAPAEFGPISRGDFWPLAAVARRNRVSPFGMRAAMDCASGVPEDRWVQVQNERETSLLQGISDFPFPDVCVAWGLGSIGDAVWGSFLSQTPAQFITGTLDGLTPVSNVEEVRGIFSGAGHLIIERMGHEGPGLWFADESVLDVVGRFLDGGLAVDTVVTAPPIDWVLPAR